MIINIQSLLLCFFLVGLLSQQGISQKTNPLEQAVELGTIAWYRNYDKAIEISRQTNKPLLILFQEVPGCATCQNYGRNILSYPLLVDAIENEFIPLVIYNNKEGEDKKILQKFNERSWNNPVIRIINPDEKELVKKLTGDYSLAAITTQIEFALLVFSGSIPIYIQLMSEEIVAEQTGLEKAYFKMSCFWSGESHLGKMEGVINTTPGYMEGHEVVEVNYDPYLIDKSELIEYAGLADCMSISDNKKFKTDKDEQYYLKKSKYRFLPLTKGQRTKINSALKDGSDPEAYLSPRQLEWKNELVDHNYHKYEVLYTLPIEEAWDLWKQNH